MSHSLFNVELITIYPIVPSKITTHSTSKELNSIWHLIWWEAPILKKVSSIKTLNNTHFETEGVYNIMFNSAFWFTKALWITNDLKIKSRGFYFKAINHKIISQVGE